MHGVDARDEALLAPIRAALGGEAFDQEWTAGRELSPEQAVVAAGDIITQTRAARASSASGYAPHDHAGLTPRELDVLRLLTQGLSDKEIGEALFIGTRTVQTHVANLFAKLGVNARAEAAAVAVRRGLV